MSVFGCVHDTRQNTDIHAHLTRIGLRTIKQLAILSHSETTTKTTKKNNKDLHLKNQNQQEK